MTEGNRTEENNPTNKQTIEKENKRKLLEKKHKNHKTKNQIKTNNKKETALITM